MFKKKKRIQELDDSTAMRIVSGGETRDVSYKELLLSTNLTLEALMSILVSKGVFTPDELIKEIETIRDKHKLAGESQSALGKENTVD